MGVGLRLVGRCGWWHVRLLEFVWEQSGLDKVTEFDDTGVPQDVGKARKALINCGVLGADPAHTGPED